MTDDPNLVESKTEIHLDDAADKLGYERIEWDATEGWYVGYGSSDPYDRSRDDLGGLLVAKSDAELIRLLAG